MLKVERLFDNVYCKNAIGYYGCLYNGYIEKTEKRQEITLVKEKNNFDVDCKFCNGNEKYNGINNKYILKRLLCKKTPSYHYVAYEKFEYNLDRFVQSKGYDQPYIMTIMKDLIKAVQSLHNYDQFHLNINPDVIMVYKSKKEYKIKLLDFFLSRDGSKESVVPLRHCREEDSLLYSAPELIYYRKLQAETIEDVDEEDVYSAPELINYRKELINYRKAAVEEVLKNPIEADVFSVGICFFFACTKSNPFIRCGTHAEQNILDEEYKIDYRIIHFSKLLDEYKKLFVWDIVKNMVKADDKISLKAVLENPFFWNNNKMTKNFFTNKYKMICPEEYLKGHNFECGRYNELKATVEKCEVSYFIIFFTLIKN